MHDLDIGYSVIVSRTKLNALTRLVEKQAYICHELVRRYSELADDTEIRQDRSSGHYWDGVVSTTQYAAKMIDEVLVAVQALTTNNEENNEKKVPSAKDTHSKNYQPHYTTSVS